MLFFKVYNVHLFFVYIHDILFEKGVFNLIRYKVDVIDMLKNTGYSTYRIRKEKILWESSLQRIRTGHVSIQDVDRLCGLLHCQPGDIVEYVDAPAEAE